ncbi:MAG: dihydrolipoyl dehydrogenase [Firmicutes bacterium]|jgi:dihydrolipoamide dehydrogenase|uniref:Dihydrolipoyl dehydrogenase n=1 Tax=Sulfobacillus benefaciens TaxID=453960 RepID=A0A2T2WWK7_9FIRM|nr:dihydrolipoyl dehydrogenase [Bacillota bacterium]MCL5012766.1 dihydrolipoyl dehydrogenase [Bacillota bacterium]PSR26620.1 MAG: dihydrolipoyl dehydrogenase [Sulfobacillus benefaciens]
MAETQFDLIVLGGGTGGYVAAIRASQLGLKTAVIDKAKVGGTCLHQGCIPTKALLNTAELFHTLQHAADYGLRAQDVALDYPKAIERKDKVVDQLYRGVQFLLKKNKVTVFDGYGRLQGPGIVDVALHDGSTTRLEAKDILVATGSVARSLPGVEFDGKRILSSDDVLNRPDVPPSVVILGGGAIGVEFASMYNDFGSRVTVVEMLPHILPQDDEEIAQQLTKLLTRRGITIYTSATFDPASLRAGNDGISAEVVKSDQTRVTVEGDVLLVAIGRKAVTENLGLEQAGVEIQRGFIAVDDHYRTNVPHIYAIGDVIGGYLLAHVAAHEGMIAVETIAGKDPELLSPHRVPRVTYSRPEVASVGISEQEAKVQGIDVKVGTFPFRANGKSLILGEADGMVKLVADKKTDALLGAHIVGPHASDLINEMALAKFLEATAWEIGESVHAHPTVSEVLHEAGLAVDGMAIHI